ncbi:MAG: hypothetical protein QOH93_2341, partial [Chloroflexia bacterium]|nr:hypothetical protein [Chloroflexia bacterium]
MSLSEEQKATIYEVELIRSRARNQAHQE